MRLMQSGAHNAHYICNESNESNALRIGGKIFYINIADIINAYSNSRIYRCEERLHFIPIDFKNICDFSSAEDLKEQMVEYLI